MAGRGEETAKAAEKKEKSVLESLTKELAISVDIPPAVSPDASPLNVPAQNQPAMLQPVPSAPAFPARNFSQFPEAYSIEGIWTGTLNGEEAGWVFVDGMYQKSSRDKIMERGTYALQGREIFLESEKKDSREIFSYTVDHDGNSLSLTDGQGATLSYQRLSPMPQYAPFLFTAPPLTAPHSPYPMPPTSPLDGQWNAAVNGTRVSTTISGTYYFTLSADGSMEYGTFSTQGNTMHMRPLMGEPYSVEYAMSPDGTSFTVSRGGQSVTYRKAM
ncbi:MAG: hypothetical protein LBB28_03410 [Synergistaceae bacterium]|nr:hypothetical protein [Synergistaceae bacterium]